MKISTSVGICFICLVTIQATPPFDGTIFLDPDIITSEDSTTYKSLSYNGTGMRTMYDRRSGWVDLEPFLFDTNFSDLPGIEIQVNPEFGSMEEALLQAERFAPVIGRLPKCLRVDVKTVWIHKGDNPFGGGNNNLLIHTGQADDYVSSESWRKPWCMKHPIHRWMAPTPTQMSGSLPKKDGEFISTYAWDNPYRGRI